MPRRRLRRPLARPRLLWPPPPGMLPSFLRSTLTRSPTPDPEALPHIKIIGHRRPGHLGCARRTWWRVVLRCVLMQTTRVRVRMREVDPVVVRVIDVPAAATLAELHELLQRSGRLPSLDFDPDGFAE